MFVYKITTQDEEVYWMDDDEGITESFGTVLEVTRYLLTNPEDVTDSVNAMA
jgi:hypothetical protein